MSWIVDGPVRPKLGLDVLVPEQTHLAWQVSAVAAKEAPVQWYGREDRQRRRSQAACHSRARQLPGSRLHVWRRWCYASQYERGFGSPVSFLCRLAHLVHWIDEYLKFRVMSGRDD